MTHDFLADLRARGLVHQTTESQLAEALARGPVTGYVGFDPTAKSLHVGSLLPVTALMRLQRAGHRPIAVVGGGTGLIGDPSGKASERTMLSAEQLAENLAGLRGQLERFLDFSGPRAATLVDNAEWLGRLNLIEFLRDIGKFFSVNVMIARDSVRLRLEKDQGISFTEFTYMLLQAYDFLELYDRRQCTLQLGGSDQWGNIVAGCDLIRRLRGGAVTHGLTMPLVTRADGRKFGKSEEGNIWLDAGMTRPYEFFQFWLNADDADVVTFLKYFTFLPVERIAELEQKVKGEPARREAQRVLAEELTALVHGKDALARALEATAVLFQGGDFRQLPVEQLLEVFAHAPTTGLSRGVLGTRDGTLAALVALAGLSPSRGQARSAIQSGSICINTQPVKEPEHQVSAGDFLGGRLLVLSRGRKTFHILRLEG